MAGSDGPSMTSAFPRLRVLLVGEGDFSFALSFASMHAFADIVATEFRNEIEVNATYPHAKDNIAALRAYGVSCFFEVDASSLARSLPLSRSGLFDEIHFNFPATGTRDGATAKVTLHCTDCSGGDLLMRVG